MSVSILKVEGLSHRYSRDWAIKDINLEVNHTGVLGLLGSNGAGKSTTMNIICGVLSPTSGAVYIDGAEIREEPKQSRMQIGFLPQVAPLHLDLTVDEYLRHCARLRLMQSNLIPRAMQEVKEQCNIAHFSKRLIRNLSGGYRQRVGIAQAIIHKPRLVVLDEPTNGLDPNQILGVRNLIKEIAKERSVIFSSHILSEIQATCENIIMIEGGKVVFSDSMDAFYNYLEPNSLIVSFVAPPEPSQLLTIPGVNKAEKVNLSEIRIQFKVPDGISASIIAASIEHGWDLKEMYYEKSSMDDVFAQLSKTVKPDRR